LSSSNVIAESLPAPIILEFFSAREDLSLFQ
jgi:hypothetical protein